MSRSLCALLIFGLSVPLPAPSAWARRAAPPKSQLRWERLRVNQVLPSQIFARLGLTHTTRHGYTRDGYTKGTPDPTFPAGLTDVVPYDQTHLLLVRGTPQGLAQFRARVLATETQIASTGRWRVTVDLLSPTGTDAPLASSDPQDVESDLPFQIAVGEPGRRQTFQLRVHQGGAAVPTVSCQAGLFPPSTGTASSVLTPAQVWTAPVTRPLAPDNTALFDDLAALRQAARRRLSLPDEADAQDYRLRVSVISLAPPVLQVPTVPDATQPPSPTSTEDNTAPLP